MDYKTDGVSKFNTRFSNNQIAVATHREQVKRLFALYSEFSNEETIIFWCDELKYYLKETVENAVTDMVNSSTSFPSMKEFKERCNVLRPAVILEDKRKEEEKNNQTAEQERRNFKKLRKAYLKACEAKGIDPDESLKRLVENWFKSEYGENAVMNGFGFSITMYERIALSDFNAKRGSEK